MTSADPARTLLAVAAVVALARAAGWLAAWARQPAVIGELLVGILLGPSILGGRPGRALIPHAVRADLSLLGTLGVILLTLLVALRLAPRGGGSCAPPRPSRADRCSCHWPPAAPWAS